MDEKDLFSKAASEFAAKITRESRTLKEEYKELLGIKTKLNDYDKEAVNLADKIQQSAKQNVVELGRSGDLVKELVKDRKIALDLERELIIAQKSLSEKERQSAQELLKNRNQQLSVLTGLEEIQEQILTANGEELELLLLQKKTLVDGLAVLEGQYDVLLESNSLDVQRYALALQSQQLQEENLENKRKEESIQDQINKKLGITGNALEGIEEIGGKFVKGFGIEKVTEHMREFAEEAIRSGKEVSRLQVLGEGVKAAFKNLGSFLTDPTVVITSMVEGFGEMEKQQREFRKLTGQNVDVFDTLNGKITTSAEYIKAAAELSKELGVNASVVFTPETIVEVAELTDNMGLAVKEAASLAKLSKVTGTELVDNAHAIEHGFQNFVKQNKTALNFGQVMSDVGKASSALTLSLGSNPERIAEAAMEARKLGLSLEQVDKIADSLLNFEESISNELEAELLTGKDLNLEKAREAALNNDIATLSKEIGKNQEILSSFSSGNRIQQEAIAKSMGMSREEMANMIYQQQIQNGLSAEQASKAADISLAEAQRLTAQEQITKAVEKLTQLAGMLLTPLNLILSNTVALGAVFTVIAVATLPKIVGGVKGFVGSLQEGLSTTKELAKNFLGLFKKGGLQEAGGKIKDFFSGASDKTKEVADKAGEGAGSAADKTKGITGKAGDNIKNFLKGLAAGLKAMSDGKVLKGALTLIPTALGLTLMTAAIPAILALSIPGLGKMFQANMTGIAKGLSALGKALPQIALGAVALALIGTALIPLTYALSLLTPLVEAFGNVILKVFEGMATLVKSVAESFVLLMDSLSLEKVGNLMLLGPALLSASIGLGAFALALAAAGVGSFLGGGIIGQIVMLAAMAEPLQTTANALTQMAVALMGVATALSQIDTDKLDSLNEFATTNTIGNAVGGIVSAITAPIQALGSAIGGGGEQSNELAEIKSILQQILAKETDIYLDTTKVGTGFAVGTSKVQ